MDAGLEASFGRVSQDWQNITEQIAAHFSCPGKPMDIGPYGSAVSKQKEESKDKTPLRELWGAKTNEQILDAVAHIGDYELEAQKVMLAELRMRGLATTPPKLAEHATTIECPGCGLLNARSIA